MDFYYKKEFETARSAIIEAGDAILKFYGEKQNVTLKKDLSPVTKADITSENIIIDGLQKFGYPILSEETLDDKSRLDVEKIWIVDPLDGTKDFIAQTGDFSILVALLKNKKPVLGLIYLPLSKVLYFAEIGKGAFKVNLNTGVLDRLSVSSKKNIRNASILISRFHLLQHEKNIIEQFKIKQSLQRGSSGVKSGLIAEGVADIYINTSNKTSEWDICAPDIIVSEAGGVLFDLYGRKIVYNKKDIKNYDGYIVSNPFFAEFLLEEYDF